MTCIAVHLKLHGLQCTRLELRLFRMRNTGLVMPLSEIFCGAVYSYVLCHVSMKKVRPPLKMAVRD